MEFHWSKMLEPCLYYNLVVYNVISEFVFQLFVFWSSVCLFQLALGQGARRFHVAAALNAKAKVAMSRFEPSSCVNYDQLRSNIDIVRKRSESIKVFYTQFYLLPPFLSLIRRLSGSFITFTEEKYFFLAFG